MTAERPRLSFHVHEAKLGGFVVQVNGEIYAAFSDARALANWVERHCGEIEMPPSSEDEDVAFPNVIRSRTGPRASWFQRG